MKKWNIWRKLKVGDIIKVRGELTEIKGVLEGDWCVTVVSKSLSGNYFTYYSEEIQEATKEEIVLYKLGIKNQTT